MASQTAIEYGARTLRLLEFDGSASRLRVLAVSEADLDVPVSEDEEIEPDDTRAERIADAVRAGKVTTDPCAMAIDTSCALFREFDLPFTGDEQIRKVVRFEAEGHIPLDIDDVVIQHVVLRKTRDKSHVLVAAIKKDDLLSRFDVLNEGDLDPMFVDIGDFALFHALVGTGVAEEHSRAVVINAQERTTSLLFLEDGDLYAVRSIRLGSHGLRMPEGDREIETARTHDYLARLRREIRRTLPTIPDFGPPDVVYVTGSGSLTEGFEGVIGETFGAEVEALDLLSRVDHKLSDEDAEQFGPDIGVALGVAFKLAGLDLTRTDFRREECAYTKKFDQVKAPLIVLSFLLFLFIAFKGLDHYNQVARLKTEYRRILASAGAQLEFLVGDNDKAAAKWSSADFGPAQVQAIFTAVRAEKEHVSMQLGRGTTIPDLPSALAVWLEFSNIILKNEDALGRFAIENLNIDLTGRVATLKLTGEVESQNRFQYLMDALGQHPLFQEVVPGSVRPTSAGSTRFSDLEVTLDTSWFGSGAQA